MNLSLGVKVLLVIICALLSALIGLGAGWMSHTPGARKRDAVLYGSGAFGGSLTLAVFVLMAIGLL
ncbi:hypothetical protein OG478_52670 [Streptomyces phaeochromogenes]|uniref:hypothetical protein n=1 Tax=Streptomyces phaeochromogenes TaxID=1923 RepID=UPI00386E2A91|nr:hypothetical protein OG478_00070 [Streptomyces phaeochromogenes]WSS99685.1 hypothetical protein OG478_52670 [Streptomyces phaeochromogenes]